MKHLLQWLAVCALSVLAACGGGDLYSDGSIYHDFNYIPSKSQPYTALTNAQPFSSAVTYKWGGTAGQVVTPAQHAVLAYTQSAFNTGYLNAAGQSLFTHGAGAYVGDRGLALELWFQQNGAGNGIYWTQDNGRCARDVQATIPPGVMCLPSYPNSAGFITDAPTFSLLKGANYTLQVSISPTSPGWSRLDANLYQAGFFGPTLVQSGAVGFQNSAFFPVSLQPLQMTVARTPGEPVISYTVLP